MDSAGAGDGVLAGEYMYVRVHVEYVARDGRDHSLAVGDLLAVTSVEKNGWSRGFKVSDPEHTELLFPSAYANPVKVKATSSSAEPEPEPAPGIAVTNSGFERARAGLQSQIGYGAVPEAGLAWTASGITLPATKSKFDQARIDLTRGEQQEDTAGGEAEEEEEPVDMSHRRVFVRVSASEATQSRVRYFQVTADGTHMPYSDEDNATIADAEKRGVACQRLSPVVLPDGQVLRFEVRFGAAAISERMAQPPPSGIVQVNLENEYTREVIKKEIGDDLLAEPITTGEKAEMTQQEDTVQTRCSTPPRPHTPPLPTQSLSQEQSDAIQTEKSLIAAEIEALDDPGSISLEPTESMPRDDARSLAPHAAASWEDVADALVRSGEFEWPGPEFDDGFNAVDYHCYIEGLGRGLIQAFERAFVGPSWHRVLLDSGESERVKLRRRKNNSTAWLVGERNMRAAASPGGEARMLTARMVPLEAVASLEMGGEGAALSKNSLTSGDGTQVMISDSCGTGILLGDELCEPEVATEYACGTPLRKRGPRPSVLELEQKQPLEPAPSIDGLQLPQRDETPETPRKTPQRAPRVDVGQTQESEEDREFRINRSDLVAMVAEEEAIHNRQLDENFAKARTESMKRRNRLFETYCVVGAPTTLREPLQELLARWSGHEENLKRLSEQGHAKAAPLSMYPPAEEIGRAELLASFCFADRVSFELNLVKQLPPTPTLQRTVFVMTEGTENPTPLYGCCLHTQEILATRDEMHVVAPRCYCLLSRVPCLNAHFALLESVLWHERRARTVNTVVETVVPKGVKTLARQSESASSETRNAEREAWSLYFNHGPECCHFICELPEDCDAFKQVKVRMPSAWRDREYEGSSDQSDESDIICMSMVRDVEIPNAVEGPTAGSFHYDPERLVIRWPKAGGSLIYDQPYGGMSLELAEWSIGTVFELLEPDSFMQLVRTFRTASS